MDFISVYPNNILLSDLDHFSVDESNVAVFTRQLPEEECALCQIGCCLQKVIHAPASLPMVVHGVAGSC